MAQENIDERIVKIVAKELDINRDNVDINANLFEQYGADSLDSLLIVIDVEREFNIKFPEETADAVKTTKDIIDEVQRQISISL